MGYRSSGGFIIVGPKDKIMGLLTEYRLLDGIEAEHKEEVLNSIIVSKFDTDELHAIKFSFNGWKWYDSYGDIQAFEKLWELAQDHEDELSGRFVRIGEDYEDIEVRNFENSKISKLSDDIRYNFLQVSVSIDFGFTMEKKDDVREHRREG